MEQQFKLPFRSFSPILECLVQVMASQLLIRLARKVHPRKQQMMAQVPGSLPSIWETWIEFWASTFSLLQPQLLKALGESEQMEDFSVSLLFNLNEVK